MTEIIETLVKNKYDVTIIDSESSPVSFFLGVIIDDMTDLWYLCQFCTEEKLDMGVPLFKENIVYFPRLVVGDEEYRLILGALQ